MAETKSQAEPTMEEILASIRRIISEDDPAGQAAAPADEPAEEAEEAAAPAEDNVLELTRKLNEDGSVVDLAEERSAANGAAVPEPAPAPAPEPEMAAEAAPEPEPEQEPEMAAEPELEPEAEPDADMAAEPDSILAAETQAATTGTLSEIAKAVAGNRRGPVQVGDGRTLEAIVREALTPELKAWLDANLAPLVEQIVRDEIKKMVRRAEDQ